MSRLHTKYASQRQMRTPRLRRANARFSSGTVRPLTLFYKHVLLIMVVESIKVISGPKGKAAEGGEEEHMQ
jgi:hypothetical protein